ncbi:MAG: 2-hydroxyacid dehydrogenase [Anaerolineales bacterium]|nr:2-hydroxyacid dehydrogenase [Anaerolineales bacterium]
MHNAFVTSDLAASQIERLESLCRVQRGGWGVTGVRLTPEELVEAASEAEILLISYEAAPARVIEALPALRLIGCTRSAPVNIDIAAATARRIPVLHAPGRNAQTAAEFTLGLMLAEAHCIARGHHALFTGRYLGAEAQDFSRADRSADITWNLDGESPFKDFQGAELVGRTLGVIGLGKIGSRVAQLARAFDMRVLAYSPYSTAGQAAALGVELAPLNELLRQADFVSIHARVTAETRGLLGRDELGLMKPGAYLINISRAALIDQAALIDALEQRRIAGAALDVFWYEPLPANHPLLRLDNVTLTPHLAGATRDVQERHSKMIVDDVLAWLDGRRPAHVANPEVWGGA